VDDGHHLYMDGHPPFFKNAVMVLKGVKLTCCLMGQQLMVFMVVFFINTVAGSR